MTTFRGGDIVRLNPGSTLWIEHESLREVVGVVIEAADLPANEDMVRVAVPGLPITSWFESQLFILDQSRDGGRSAESENQPFGGVTVGRGRSRS